MVEQKKYDLVIIGAGPAGLTAAIRAAERGKKVIILEKGPSAGRKLLLCGNRRCNITNAEKDPQLFVTNYMKNPKFMLSMLYNYSNSDVMRFFESRGVALKLEPGLKVFPKSNKAEDVLNVLLARLKELEVAILYEVNVASLLIGEMEDGRRETLGVKTDKGDFFGEKVLIATGGKTHQKTGATGDGYRFAEELGHKIITPQKALYPFEIENNEACREMAGLTVEAGVTFKNNSGVLHKEIGSILFAEFGISGPVMINASLYVAKSQMSGLALYVNFFPGTGEPDVEAMLIEAIKKNPNKNIENILPDLLPASLVPVVLKLAGIDLGKKGNQVSSDERKRAVKQLTSMEFIVSKYVNVNKSVATDGGIDLKEIDNRTLESKLVKNLYFAGEVIDVIGKTGGFNLQAAWSTGWTVGNVI